MRQFKDTICIGISNLCYLVSSILICYISRAVSGMFLSAPQQSCYAMARPAPRRYSSSVTQLIFSNCNNIFSKRGYSFIVNMSSRSWLLSTLYERFNIIYMYVSSSSSLSVKVVRHYLYNNSWRVTMIHACAVDPDRASCLPRTCQIRAGAS